MSSTGRGHPVGLYAPLQWQGYHAAHPLTARLLWVGETVAHSCYQLFTDCFYRCPSALSANLHCLASTEGGAHMGLAMRAARNAALISARKECCYEIGNGPAAIQAINRRPKLDADLQYLPNESAGLCYIWAWSERTATIPRSAMRFWKMQLL